jgi:hypothetical protein
VFCSLEGHLRTEIRDFDHPVLAGVKNTDKFRMMICRLMQTVAEELVIEKEKKTDVTSKEKKCSPPICCLLVSMYV